MELTQYTLTNISIQNIKNYQFGKLKDNIKSYFECLYKENGFKYIYKRVYKDQEDDKVQIRIKKLVN